MTPRGGPPSARAAIAAVADGFTELPGAEAAQPADGPLGWSGYDAGRERAAERTGESESVVCGVATLGGTRALLVAFEFGFLGGSLGSRTGDRLEAAHARARELSLPVVSLIATGGSRMQEGMRALTQLQRVARQAALTRGAGLPQIAVLRDPATGGGWATLGAGADVTLALPGAQIGFAGSRVRPADADPRAYTAEEQLATGHVDAVVPEGELRGTLGRWLELLGTRPARDGRAVPPADPPAALGTDALPASGWAAVRQARAAGRPRADAYLTAHFTARAELSGDRCGGVDTGVRCGFGRYAGRTVAYAAQLGTATRPAGFRTAARLIRLAGRLGLPVLTLVDTPGAANDAAAERAGAGAAIAECFAAVAESPVPVTTLVVGEGGSGGALALASPGRTWMTPDSYFSVIAPELAAAILKRGPQDVRATADQLRIRPQDVVALGAAEGIVSSASRPAESSRSAGS
ncbi:carboxyl transferase domain-containing protein [Streptomyces sp. TRM 70351]|uniref:carboxyl transferase domain-containing protein n=1 Tax=Streptomyces sp. TRM 70351 TaxID=3116552 RepID=UPI002E7B547A|nr:carboxyl transferase domain-containing protein [Streptomyces sp. TRM 70351]MEE1927205.1 carboxyl transferase domain-containing protein [Streptomyces sp. TRM 70351]